MTFGEFCRTLGILSPEGMEEGRWIRCGTESKPRGKTGAVQLNLGGESGAAIDFATMTEHAVWRKKDGTERKRVSAEQVDAERRAREEERRRLETAGTKAAVEIWKKAEPMKLASHPYCARKKITMRGAMGLRVFNSSLLIPMIRGENLVSIQRIDENGKKLFAASAPSKGCVYWIERKNPVVTILCEGWGTGMTLAEAVPFAKVCVSFSAANMIEVAKLLDWSGLVCVAGDNDHEKPCPYCLKDGQHLQNPPNQKRPDQCRCNPGWSAAIDAAKIIGCGLAIPPAGEGMTDFNDWFCAMLAEKEKAVENEKWKPHISKLRQAAGAPINAAIMSAARDVNRKKIEELF